MQVISVENLSKTYRLGQLGSGTLTRDIESFFARLFKLEDPHLKIGNTFGGNNKSGKDFVNSLENINFSLNQGDSLGIIGKNGSGKSTLLKVLSQITAPTSGKIKLRGRVASLLEVGTGFHPELTGRENIFLNGAILGMKRYEIKRNFDEIVAFSGVEKYIDTPVKRYSSGMYVRLAFAVAAHLESEILIVDEVLAVGDAEFQEKCLSKMNDINSKEGRTILFVSHNMDAIKNLCNKGLLLVDGKLDSFGEIEMVSSRYLAKATNNLKLNFLNYISEIKSNLSINSIQINGIASGAVQVSEILEIEIEANAEDVISGNFEVSLFSTTNSLILFHAPGHFDGEIIKINKGIFILKKTLKMPPNINSGQLFLNIAFAYPNVESFFTVSNVPVHIEEKFTKGSRLMSFSDFGFFKI